MGNAFAPGETGVETQQMLCEREFITAVPIRPVWTSLPITHCDVTVKRNRRVRVSARVCRGMCKDAKEIFVRGCIISMLA